MILFGTAGIGALLAVLTLVFGLSWFPDATEKIAYKRLEHRTLSTLVFRPPNHNIGDGDPCIVWFFGGAWRGGSPYQFAPYAEHFTKLGIVSICPDYRVASRDGSTPFESTEDAISAMRWVRRNSNGFGIDPHRIAAAGASAGGQLAASCAFLPEDESLAPESYASPIPNALILFNPVLDFDIPKIREHSSQEEQVRLRQIAPYHQMKNLPSPTIIFHGTADRVVPIDSVERFMTRASTLGPQSITLVTFPGRPHDFFVDGGGDDLRIIQKIEEFLQSLDWIED